ncbi:MAG: glycosyltransferase family 39 protein [Bacteroidales bacterium]|nr:glycosyltransferase family 39 protein [Bacteroidales bacterium]
MPSNRKINIALIVLLVLSAVARGLIAGSIELGNDEVYYWTYAKFPALSHFDHPPMVGFVIQLFTFNLTFDSEFFLRLAAVVLGTFSTWFMFLIGRLIKNSLTGLYAALLFTGSFYGFILSGTFILPDSPQVFFWLLTLYLLLKSLTDTDLTSVSRNALFMAGVTAGLALLSKYHSVFLVTGAFMYVLLYNRKWFRAKELYGAFLVLALLFLPVIFWNIENQFISFTFHENRIGITESGIQPQYFFTEVIGQFFYNNPVNVVIIVIALVALMRRRSFLEKSYTRLILWISLPLLLIFLGFSLFRSTLPHWTGPAYLGLILIAAAYLSGPLNVEVKRKLVPWPILVSLLLLSSVAVLGTIQINRGFLPFKKWKVDDISLDLYGWEQLGTKFAAQAKWDESNYLIDKGSPIVTFRWFPAANLDYYLARKINKVVYALGPLERIHKYFWINKERGNLKKGSDAYYLAFSDDYEDPVAQYGKLFEMILPSDTIFILRNQDTVRKVFVFRLIDLKQDMIFVPETHKTPAKSIKATTADTLAFFLNQIRSDRQYLDILEKKSVKENIPLEDLIHVEALKMLEQSKDLEVKMDTNKVEP